MLLNRLGLAGLLALPGVLTIYLGFVAGGFFPGQPAQVALFLALVLVMVTTLVERPFGGLGRSLGVAIAAFALLGLWTLLSSQWSGSSARALVEFMRVLAYLLALVVFGSLATSHHRLRWLLRSVALGVFVVSVAGLISRVVPDVVPVVPTLQPQRLSYPVTYWNTLGLMASIGIICCFGLSCDDRESPLSRILGTAAIPALAVTLLFTFSRGAIGVAVLGLAVFLVVARPPLALTTGAVAVPLTAIALLVAYHADQLATGKPVVREAISQGHRVALVVVACVILAGGARALLLAAFDAPLIGYRLPERFRPLRIPAVAVAAVILVAILLVLDVPRAVSNQYEHFLHEETVKTQNAQDYRQRLTSAGNNHRIQQWKVAIEDFQRARWKGEGAGTYELSWARYRPIASQVRDAHSLYLEVAGELGVVGILLLAAGLISLAVGIVSRAHRPQRVLYGAVLAAFIAWALEAGIDWQWEMPAITLPILALAGAGAARKSPASDLDVGLSQGARVLISIGWLIVAIAPALLAISDGRLVRAARAFNDRDDCRAASVGSLSSISALGNRPQPYEVLGYCNLERGFPLSAMQAMQKAVQQDPRNWRYRYGLAVAEGEAGLDPRADAREALALNPREQIARQALVRFGADRRNWPADAAANADALFSTGPVGAR